MAESGWGRGWQRLVPITTAVARCPRPDGRRGTSAGCAGGGRSGGCQRRAAAPDAPDGGRSDLHSAGRGG
ncbi:MAG TPA: hypothetical protein DC048_06195 [Planctomycetaceae bacterium]|nr:hypothetical protein [Planctomycetaceae bacterium]